MQRRPEPIPPQMPARHASGLKRFGVLQRPDSIYPQPQLPLENVPKSCDSGHPWPPFGVGWFLTNSPNTTEAIFVKSLHQRVLSPIFMPFVTVPVYSAGIQSDTRPDVAGGGNAQTRAAPNELRRDCGPLERLGTVSANPSGRPAGRITIPIAPAVDRERCLSRPPQSHRTPCRQTTTQAIRPPEPLSTSNAKSTSIQMTYGLSSCHSGLSPFILCKMVAVLIVVPVYCGEHAAIGQNRYSVLGANLGRALGLPWFASGQASTGII